MQEPGCAQLENTLYLYEEEKPDTGSTEVNDSSSLFLGTGNAHVGGELFL